jgi:hypothetical protein
LTGAAGAPHGVSTQQQSESYSTQKTAAMRATLEPHSVDTTRTMETPEVVAISTPDLHPLELYFVHTSLSFLCISGSLVESLSSRSLCSFLPVAPPFPPLYSPGRSPFCCANPGYPFSSIFCCTSIPHTPRCTSLASSSLQSRSRV